MDSFIIFQFMFLILDALNDENERENLIVYLSDANPYIWEGETSADPIVFDEFDKKYSKYADKSDFAYFFICDYLKNIDPYYGDIYSIFMQLSKEEYVDTCKNILENYPEKLKK